MIKISILGCGFTGQAIARHCLAEGATRDVIGTRRNEDGVAGLVAQGIPALLLDGPPSQDVISRLEQTTHLISSVAPARAEPLQDPMLDLARSLAGAGRLPRLRWIGYLSTIGVYGDHQGEWIDEDTPCTSGQLRSMMRMQAEQRWQELAEQIGANASVLRLSGIYGPGRNALEDVRAGRARRVVKRNHVFNRIHVDDIARFARQLIERNLGGVFNVTDDEPAPSADVVAHACDLLGCPAPVPIAFEDVEMSPMALSFWAECKRVDNRRGKQLLDFTYRYPSFREGLEALHAESGDGAPA